MQAHLRRICVTGPECTGKTTLARELAEYLGTEWVPEAARRYAERVARSLTADDVLPIAREHISMADSVVNDVRAAGGRSVVFDTDLVSTVVYGKHYYGFDDYWLTGESVRRMSDIYLLCDVDLAWEPDGIRDQPESADVLYAAFTKELQQLCANICVIRGSGDARRLAAIRALAKL